MAYVKLEDNYGRIIHVPVFNESEDGSGTWHVPVCDTSGYLKVAMQSVLDNILWKIGTDDDFVFVLNSAGLSADAELADVIVGTSDHPGVAANSLIGSNITASGDILLLVNKGGNSIAAFWADGSTGDVALLAATGQSVDFYVGGTKFMDISNNGTITTFLGLSGDYFRIGDAGTTDHAINSEDDLMVTGDFEVDGTSYIDGQSTFANHLTLGSGVQIHGHTATDAKNQFMARNRGVADVEIAAMHEANDPYWSFNSGEDGRQVAFEYGNIPITNFKVVKVTKAHGSDLFDAGAATDNATIWTQPVDTVLIHAMMRLETQFAGTGPISDLRVTMGLVGYDD
ncbi:hypothetical protein LCGC14_1905360, partial [marine sediment metagenome]